MVEPESFFLFLYQLRGVDAFSHIEECLPGFEESEHISSSDTLIICEKGDGAPKSTRDGFVQFCVVVLNEGLLPLPMMCALIFYTTHHNACCL